MALIFVSQQLLRHLLCVVELSSGSWKYRSSRGRDSVSRRREKLYPVSCFVNWSEESLWEQVLSPSVELPLPASTVQFPTMGFGKAQTCVSLSGLLSKLRSSLVHD